ncbi:hypothetical protein PS662_04901 [Pseudomonas fluorescens]|uniref:Uncharacterized protein n=1 Tax=Pseudomonas fluorescens TaxID=294 RepID=A0A5E6WRA0_PSEFL|nr:hypothetical protein [Pseudomonas fluorescens]VVN31419.1 hypothetical protein PS662_04901 [Pseudomonas fluorescens]
MNYATENWNNCPLLRAGSNVINTQAQSDNEITCGRVTTRYNVANIHEIKKVWDTLKD